MKCADSMELRPFRPTDLDCILQIEKSSFDEADAYTVSEFQSLYQEHSQGFIFAQQGGQVMGYIIGNVSNNNGELDSLAVDPNFRRLGVAKKLVLTVLESFRENGVSTAIAQVRTSNEAAILFYQKLGFRIEDTLKHYYTDGTNAYLMKIDFLIPSLIIE